MGETSRNAQLLPSQPTPLDMKPLEVTALQLILGIYFFPQNYQKASFNIKHLQKKEIKVN